METIQKEITVNNLLDDYLFPIDLHIEKAKNLCNVLCRNYLTKSSDLIREDEFESAVFATSYFDIQTLVDVIFDNLLDAQRLMKKVHQIKLANIREVGR